FATIHRPYNTDNPARMKRILDMLNLLPHPVIFPLHPRTAARLKAAEIHTNHHPHIQFIDPLGYLNSIAYQRGSECIITDSGGVQKEAYMLRKKCITLRSETEWTETLDHSWNTLVFEDIESIPKLIKEKPGTYIEGMFGDGHAAEKIVTAIKNFFKQQSPATA
ncbi:MAG: UDP-N-acetylglucosamine 2-epimerase, partial [Chitinophagaceae bacterium]